MGRKEPVTLPLVRTKDLEMIWMTGILPRLERKLALAY